jgi:hypothetical protein
MDKYVPLYNYLRQSNKQAIMLSLKDIERIIGDALPKSAYNYPAFWSNGEKSHSHAHYWMDAGYIVSECNLVEGKIGFQKVDDKEDVAAIHLCGYDFRFLQNIEPERDVDGRIIEDYPQNKYCNDKNLKIHRYGEGSFCKFKIKAENVPGVYLWVVDDEIIYIGETADLRNRFNTGYGIISARNCFEGGQTTNCKMNKVVLEMAKLNKTISLYFYQTDNYKQVELELLKTINTKYNVKDN